MDQRRNAVRRDDGAGVPVERQNQAQGVMLTGVGQGLTDDVLMAEVHAVEYADGQADLSAAGGEFGCGIDPLHHVKNSQDVFRPQPAANTGALSSPTPAP